MTISFKDIRQNLISSSLFKDSFWAVFGNGLGYFLLLVAGIVIARFLGKDIYGEYGVVKTTMFHIASFATLGLGFTATRFVAKYKDTDDSLLKGSIYSSLIITTVSSSFLCILLFVFSIPLAEYLEEPGLATPFRFLGAIIIVRALCTTTGAILGGTKNFKAVGINNIISGISMLALGIGFTYLWGLNGSLFALLISQAILCFSNILSIYQIILKQQKSVQTQSNIIDLLKFTIPVSLQELTYTICHLGVPFLLTKYASMGEVGVYGAAFQWNAIILFVPSLLSNVVLAYLSGEKTDNGQYKILKYMLLANFLATVVPFIIVYVLSDIITSLYGPTFSSMSNVINILVFSTIFDCMSRVFQSNLISEGKNWILFLFRTIRDVSLLIIAYITLCSGSQIDAACKIAMINLFVCIGYCFLLAMEYYMSHQYNKSNNSSDFKEV